MYNACLDELHPALEYGHLFRKTSIESMTGKAENTALFVPPISAGMLDRDNTNVWLPSTCRGNISHAVVAIAATYTQTPAAT